MTEYESTEIVCGDTKEMIRVTNQIIENLPDGVRTQFRKAVDKYLIGNFRQAFEHVNGKTVGQLLAEQTSVDTRVVESGEQCGAKYTLYDKHAEQTRNQL